MRYLLLSVLVVSLVGVLVIPNVYTFDVYRGDEPDPFRQQQNPNQQMADMAERLGITVEPTGNLDKLIPGEWSVFDEVYFALEYPISDENPFIEMYTATVSHAETGAGVVFYKHSSNDIAKQHRNELVMQNRSYLSQYGDVNLTYDSSCKAGVLSEIPALLCSKNDIVVYVGGYGNIGKLTTAILGNIKSSFMPIEPLYIIIGAVAIGGVIAGVIVVAKRGSSGTSAPKPARQDLDDYEEQYLRRQGQRPTRKPAETRPTSSSCSSCGRPLKPTAKFCGKCGSKQ